MKYYIWPLLILLIVAHYFASRPVYKDGDKIRISGVIYADPIRYTSSNYLKFGGLKIYLPLFPEIGYGDRVVLEGKVLGGELNNLKVVSVSENVGALSNLRKKIIAFYSKYLPEPEGGLLAGIVLGSKSSLSSDFYNRTKKAGVAHVVVASGTNVTFVVSFLSALIFLFLKRKVAIPFIILSIILYLFISGFEAPLVRAAIMSGALFLGQEMGRPVSTIRIFFLTAAIMLLINPEWITDIGFLLSFASTGSILFFEKKVENFLKFVPGIVKQDLSTTLSAQIGITPILFVTFGQFNIWSPVANILILWTVPLLMFIGALGGAIGIFMPLFGKLIVWLAYPLLWWFAKVVALFS